MMVPEHFHARRLKHRSQSMPLINPIILSQPIHKDKKIRQKRQKNFEQHREHLPILSLFSIHDRQEQELNSKIKVIAERSLKKLEERYDTIDRWKKKYIPDTSHIIPRAKFNSNETCLPIEEKEDSSEPITPVSSTPWKPERLFPIVTKPAINPQIPDQREQSRKLEEQLLVRLQKNKRYYQIDSSETFQEINYFEQSNYRQVEKRGEEIKKLLGGGVRKNKLLDIVHKKMSEPELDSGRKKVPSFQLFDGSLNLAKLKMKKPNSINEFKEQLMKQAVEQVPEGWDFENQPNPALELNEQAVE